MLLFKRRIKGNTMVEVLIALTITSFCTTLAVIIYLNVQKSSLPFFKVKATELADYYMAKTIRESSFMEETFTEEEFSVKKTVTVHELLNDCYVLRILVFDPSKKKIAELERTVYRGN